MAISGSGHGDAVLRRALAEQTNQLYSHMPISMTGTIINGAILVYVLWNAVSRSVIIAWYATALVITFIRYLIWFAHKKTSPEHKNTIFWFRLQAIGIGAAGLVWGACSLLMFVPDSIVHQVFLAFIIAGMAAGGMASYAVRMDTFCLFAVPLLTPLAIAFFTARGSLPTLMGAMTVLLGLIITATAKRMSQTFTNSIELTMKNDDLLRSLKREKENAEAANKAKSKFLANMSHELRTPLNGITGLADLLSMTSQTEEQQEYTANIKQSSSVLCTLIGDILDFSKIEADKIRLENIEFSLRELLESVSDLFARNAFDRNLDFGCLIKDDVPDRLIGDSSRLRQILT
ncbi:MAG: histidine kinase dimerization/phospho-acceptor domain-containing protein, partial [Desulfosudaceae bacterium]